MGRHSSLIRFSHGDNFDSRQVSQAGQIVPSMNVFQTHKSQSCRHFGCFSIDSEAPSYVFGFGKATANAGQALSSEVVSSALEVRKFRGAKDTKGLQTSSAGRSWTAECCIRWTE